MEIFDIQHQCRNPAGRLKIPKSGF